MNNWIKKLLGLFVPMGGATIEQTHHGVYDDDNSDVDSCTEASTEDARFTADVDTNYLVRLKVKIGGMSINNITSQFEYNNVTQATGWVAITTSSTHVRAVAGTPTDGDVCDTEIMANDGGTFQTLGEYTEDGLTSQQTMAVGEWEFACCVQLRSADVATGDDINIRLTNGSVTVTETEVDVFDVAAGSTTPAVGTTTFIGALDAVGEHTGVTGTITMTGDLVGTHVSRAFGTILATGTLAAIGSEFTPVLGTITATGALDADGITSTFGVITFIGELIAGGGHTGVTATSTFSASLTAKGVDLTAGFEQNSSGVTFGSAHHVLSVVPTGPVMHSGVLEVASVSSALGTITVIGDLDALGEHTGITGTSTFSGDLVADGTTSVTATITFSGDLDAVGAKILLALGTITITGDLDADGINLASGTSTFSGDLVALGEHTGITGTSTFIGDLAAIGVDLSNETKFALGTITATGDLSASGEGLVFVAATITATGDLVSQGTTNARGTITILGVGLSEGTHLAAGTITATGEVAASGIQLAGGTSTFSGQLGAVGTDISIVETLPPGRGVFAPEVPLLRDYGVLPVGIQLEEGVPPTKGTITVIGSLVAQTGNVQVSGTITVTGELSVLPPHDLFNIAATTIFADEVPQPLPYIWLHRGVPFSTGTEGTIRVTGALSTNSDVTMFAFGTITFLGAVSTQQEGFVNATATITVVGDLVATAATTIVNISGTITIFGAASGVPGQAQAKATINYTGELTALGTIPANILTPTATITAIGKLEAIPFSYCPISRTATFNIIGSLSAVEDPLDDIVTASGSILVDSGLSSLPPTFFFDGTYYLARGNIALIGLLSEAHATPGTCLTPTATLTIPGAIMSAFGGDLNQKFKSATITFFGSLDISAVYAREESISIAGELTARGRNLPIGTSMMLSQRAAIATSGQIGAGTIDGRKTAVINEPYGSLEMYNNGQGGFYSIGANGALKEVFALMNYFVDINAKGVKDQTKFAKGTITVTGELIMVGRHTGVAAMIAGIGSVIAEGMTLAQGTITMTGNIAAIAAQIFAPTYNRDRAPAFAAISQAHWEHHVGFMLAQANATASARIYIVNDTNDCIIKVDGTASGAVTQNVNNPQATATIFNLNVRPDTVSIKEEIWPVDDSDPLNYPSDAVKIGSFTLFPVTDFDPTNGVEYGIDYQTFVEAQAPGGFPPTANEHGSADANVTFTFKKMGYSDLVLTYRMWSQSIAQASSTI